VPESRKVLRHGLPFQVDVGSRLVHRCVQVRMAEPLTDGGEADYRLEKANCSRMSHRMRMDSLVGRRRRQPQARRPPPMRLSATAIAA